MLATISYVIRFPIKLKFVSVIILQMFLLTRKYVSNNNSLPPSVRAVRMYYVWGVHLTKYLLVYSTDSGTDSINSTISVTYDENWLKIDVIQIYKHGKGFPYKSYCICFLLLLFLL